MKNFPGLTRERVCGAYILLSIVIAMLIPTGFAIEKYIGFDVGFLPWLHTMMGVPGRLPSLTTYFLIMWTLFPVFVLGIFLAPSIAVPVISSPDRFAPLRTWNFGIALWACVAIFLYVMYGVDLTTPAAGHGYFLFALSARYRIFLGLGGGVMMMCTALISCAMVFYVVLMSRQTG